MILVAGESLVDLIEADGWHVSARPGGAPFNVARGVARLGVPCRFLGGISTDRYGRMLRDELVADGVGADRLVVGDRPTALAVAEINDGTAEYRFYLDGTSAAAVPADAGPAALDPDTAIVYLGGLALWLEPIGTAVERLVEHVSSTVIVMLDPNIRPPAIVDEALARARLARLLARADVVKVSVEDLDWMSPGVGTVDAARRLLDGGCACVLLTEGADGAHVLTRDAELHVPASPVDVVDTIGAGDAYCAGFAAWWAGAGHTSAELGDIDLLESAAQHAALVAAITCERVGAAPPTAVEVGARLAAT